MKDKKININVGYEKLSKEEIGSHKDFSKVYESYLSTKMQPLKVAKKFPFTKIMLVTTVTAVIVTTVVWKYKSAPAPKQVAVKHNPAPVVKTQAVTKKPFINPPIKKADVPYKAYTVDVSKGGVLDYNKSKITIPSHAFCDEKGNEVKGSVTINYREFHDAIDFFVSGIPMTYDSAGVKYNFESAGMLDIQGNQNGKPVYVKQGKNIQVAMSSFQTGTKYNVYKLDTVKKSWTYIEKSKYVVQQSKKNNAKVHPDTVSNIPQKAQTQLATINKALTKLEAAKPAKPEEANDNNYTLSIDADNKDFPELSGYQNVLFEVDPSNKNYNPKWENTLWTDAKLKRKDNGKDYIFSISNPAEKHDILVHPVFKGKNYEQAMQEYTQKYNEYEAKVEEKKEDLRKEKEAQEKMIAEMKKKQEDEDAKAQAAMQKQIATMSLQQKVTSYFTIRKFGIWNSDCPQARPEGATLAAIYTDNRRDNLNSNWVYLAEKGKNAVVIEDYPVGTFSFNPKERNFAWTVTSDQKLAIYNEEDFKKINRTNGDYTFVLTVLDNEITSYDDVRRALQPYMD